MPSHTPMERKRKKLFPVNKKKKKGKKKKKKIGGLK